MLTLFPVVAHNITVTLNIEPVSIWHPAFTLECHIEVNRPTLSSHQTSIDISWWKDNVLISKNDRFSPECTKFNRRSRTLSKSLLAINPTLEDEGLYECRATYVNKTYSSRKNLTIFGRKILTFSLGLLYLRMLDRHSEKAVRRMSKTRLSCRRKEASGTFWTKDGRPLLNETRSYVEVNLKQCTDQAFYECTQWIAQGGGSLEETVASYSVSLQGTYFHCCYEMLWKSV